MRCVSAMTGTRQMPRAWPYLLKTLYPANCVLCRAPGRDADTGLCPGCLEDLPRNRIACRRCAIPIGAGHTLCARCRRQPPAFDATLAPWLYQGSMIHLIHRLKSLGQQPYARLLGRLLAERLADRATPRPELILPVPAHRLRLRERGFNPAVEIARALSHANGVPMRVDLLRKVRVTEHQSALPREQRLRNLRNAFSLNGEIPARHVVLLDDVITTGATTRELARLLKRHGIARVDVWAVARTP